MSKFWQQTMALFLAFALVFGTLVPVVAWAEEPVSVDAPAEEQTQTEPKEQLPAEEEEVSEETEPNREEEHNEMELGDKAQNVRVKRGAPSNHGELSMIAKGNDGKYYGIRTTNTDADTSANRVLEEISAEDYKKASAEFALNFKRKDGTAFEIPRAKIVGQATEAGAIFLEFECRHYSAYRGVMENCNPTEVTGTEDAIWAIMLKKDLDIEPVPNYGGSTLNASSFFINYRCELDGNGFKVYRSGGKNANRLFDIVGTQEVALQNITIDGSKNLDGTPQYSGIKVEKGAKLKLTGNVVIQNCKWSNPLLVSAITVMPGASLTIGGGNHVIQNCVSDAKNGSIHVFGSNINEGATVISIDGTSFLNNKAKSGAAISVSYFHATVTITNCKFENNEATDGEGGAIRSNSWITVQGSTFTGNKASGLGGALYSNKGAKLENVSFTNNKGQFGGAIRCFKNLELINGEFRKNTSETDGGAIAATGSVKVVGGSFDENKAERGGAVYIDDSKDNGYQTSFKDVTFKSNVAEHGGAIFSSDQKVTVDHCTLKENKATFGGALYADGIYRDEDYKELTNLKVTIQNGNTFEANHATKEGGAIYTTPHQYNDPIDMRRKKPIEERKPYQNLSIDETVLFKSNKADGGLFNPPENYKDFTNLKFDPRSDVKHEKLTRNSLLNNYDVNYDNNMRTITYDANGGRFDDNTKIKTEEHAVGANITIRNAPTRRGYTFKYWKGSEYQPGEPYTVKDNHTFIAQWEKDESTPQPPKTEQIIVDPNGGTFTDGTTGRKTYDLKIGETFLLPEAPTRKGYKFIAWQSQDAEYQPGYPYIVKTGGEVFTARWEKDKKSEEKPSVTPNIKTPKGTPLMPDEIAKILAGIKKTVPAIPKAGVGK